MVFNVEDRILVENLYKFKGHRAKNCKFPNKGWTVNNLNYLRKKMRDTGTRAIGNQEVDDVRVRV